MNTTNPKCPGCEGDIVLTNHLGALYECEACGEKYSGVDVDDIKRGDYNPLQISAGVDSVKEGGCNPF